jgi:hypothetical protein
MAPSRRTFITVGLLGAAALAVGGVGLGLRPTVAHTPRRPLRILDATSFSILAAVVDRVARGDGLPDAAALGVAEDVDGVLASLHPEAAAQVVQVLQLLENALAGLVLDQRFTTFTGSSPEVQDRVLRSWATSSWSLQRTGYRALHGLIIGAYWAHEELDAVIGYAGPPPLHGLLDRAEPVEGDDVFDAVDTDVPVAP